MRQPPAIGSLFSGYGGLDQGVTTALGGGRVAWHCEIEPAAVRVLDHHHPGVPNLGDITAVDWAAVEPIDVLTGGFPCQDVSAAGRRAGIRPGTRSGLWTHMAYAIDQLRPGLVVIENVKGLLSADAACDLEPCPWCVGDGGGRPLRALGAVLGDLANLGYDAQWVGLRAADVGAPHGRMRIFITAVAPGASVVADSDRGRRAQPDQRQRHPGVTCASGSLSWGPYRQAVERWEAILGRPAPRPAAYHRDGEYLNPAAVEWMMGLPAGYVTEVPGVTRRAQLTLLGNGVVPQQAEAALRWLLPGEAANTVAA